MRKIYINNDRNQIAFFIGVINEGVVIEDINGYIKVVPLDSVGLLDFDKREEVKQDDIEDYRKQLETNIFSTLISREYDFSKDNILQLSEKAKNITQYFIDSYNE